MFHIYVLKCSNDKYYVGKTTIDVNRRFMQHLSKDNTCTFTNTYSPIEIIEIYDTTDSLDEDKTTKKYMMMFGIDNVRGGSYTKLKLEDWQIKSLEHEFVSVSDTCFKCKQFGHKVSNCNSDSELDIYLNSFDTEEKINDEIGKIGKLYNKILILKQQITDTNDFVIEQLSNVKKLATLINERDAVFTLIKIEMTPDDPHCAMIKKRRPNHLDDEFHSLESQISSLNFGHRNGGIAFSDHIKQSHSKIFRDEFKNKTQTQGGIRQIVPTEIWDDIYIKFLQLVNYNLDKKRELFNNIEMLGSDENIKYKLTNLYEIRIKFIL
jgi:predicted GIY-YIG superfamily endonuclease